MLHRTFLRALVALPIALSAPAIAGAQSPETDAPAETAEQAQPAVEFGGPEPVVIVGAGEGGLGGAVLVEIATTPEQLTAGLAGRETLGEDEGMLFRYATPRLASRTMENVFIGLDFVFIDAGGEVVKTISYAQPGALRPLTSDFPVSGVLALPAGRAAALGATPGASVQHAFFGNLPEPDAPAETEEEAGEPTEDAGEESPQDEG